jgi:hypothetical protein
MSDPTNLTASRDLIRRMATLIDGLQEAMNRAAVVERAAEHGKLLRKTTLQRRADAARALVAEVIEYLGEDHG